MQVLLIVSSVQTHNCITLYIYVLCFKKTGIAAAAVAAAVGASALDRTNRMCVVHPQCNNDEKKK